MTEREKIIIVIAIILLLGVVGLGFYFQFWREKPTEEVIVPVQELIRNSEELQEKKYTPETPKNATTTKPTEIIPLENSNNQQGFFSITASASGYTPASITVKSGDIMTLQLTAQGADYDMFSSSMGFYVSAKKGETGKISFQTSLPGTFLFECRDNCPITGKIQGTIIVLP